MIRRLEFLALVTTLLGAIPSLQQSSSEKRSVNDALFAQAAAVSGLSEVAVSELGSQKATRNDLKAFSRRMIEDHTQANNELMAIARQKQIALPREVDARAAFCYQSLSGLSADDFDKCFAKAQLVAHMEALATFEAEAERGQDADLKAFASKIVPKIREHIKMLKPIAKELNKDLREDEQSESKKSK